MTGEYKVSAWDVSGFLLDSTVFRVESDDIETAAYEYAERWAEDIEGVFEWEYSLINVT